VMVWIGRVGGRLNDLHMLLRSLGYIPAWLYAVLVVFVWSRGHADGARLRFAGLALAFHTAVAGILAAVLKVLIRRPDMPQELRAWDVVDDRGATLAHYPGWQWQPWGDEPWQAADLCCPSEHAAVAWGAMLAIARLRPSVAPLVLLLALGTAICRVRARGHYPTDTLGSLFTALAAAWLFDRLARRWRRPATRSGDRPESR
ncbi:MAG TPA: phosphatase PAP2 family protein, partial [bacterium]|nr:phosphatase PAP2 family protein [bacterium]